MSEMDGRQPLLFRRRRFEAPHRRRHPLVRLLRPLAGALAVVGLPAALSYWVMTSPQLEIGDLVVGSTGRVSPAWLEKRLEPLRGRHLLGVGLEEVEELLAEHPWIEQVALRRRLPGRLEVAVVERRPAALWLEDGALFFVDAGGRRIAPVTADSGELDLPVLSAEEGGPDAVARAVSVAKRWQELRPGDPLSEVEVLASGDFRLVTLRLPFAILVSSDRLAAAPAALDRAAPLINRRFGPVAAVDLRFSRQIVFQPAALPPREEG